MSGLVYRTERVRFFILAILLYISDCENGRPDIKATNLNYHDRSLVYSKVIGWVNNISECAWKCVTSTNFFCKSIQIYEHRQDESVEFHCKLLSVFADDTSESFLSYEDAISKIYNIHCDSKYNQLRCIVSFIE